MIWSKPIFLFLIASAVFSIEPGNTIIRGETVGKETSKQGSFHAPSSKGCFIARPTPFLTQGTTSPVRSGSDKVKHHQRTIASEAILAVFSIPPPQFSFYQRNYSLFLPDKCAQWCLTGSSLRGPPFRG